jgi:hypothetical protein
MDAPKLCLHQETRYNVDRTARGLKRHVVYHGYLVDWQCPQYLEKFPHGLLAVECQILPAWLADSRRSDGSYDRLAHWAVKLIYHTPVRHLRPLAYSKGIERIAQECRWQQVDSFVPYGEPSVPCLERRLLYGFSHRVLQAHRYGDEAVFDALQAVWTRIFRPQYEYYLRLTS